MLFLAIYLNLFVLSPEVRSDNTAFAGNETADTARKHLFEMVDRNFFEESRTEDHHEPDDAASSTLNELLNRLSERGYDSRFRPHLHGRPIYVSCSIYIGSISSISESNMDYTIDFYFRQSWDDYRLTWNSTDDEPVNLAGDNMEFMWMPDSTFPNVKHASFHFVTRQNGFVRVSPRGHVRMSTRIKLTASCPMDLRDFPMDTPCCALYIQSFSLPITDIIYGWLQEQSNMHYSEDTSNDDNSDGTQIVDSTNYTSTPTTIVSHHHAVGFDSEVLSKLTTFVITGYRVEEVVVVTHDGYNHSRLAVHIYFARNLGYYVIQVYLPATLMVTSSWVSFWLPRQSSPARVTLGVTTILVCVTLSGQQYISMPKISYLKAIDIYLLTCFGTVFLAFVEFAVVSYSLTRSNKSRARRQRRDNKIRRSDCFGEFDQPIHCRFMIPEITVSMPDEEKILHTPKWVTLLPSRIENVSRVLFPSLFIIFNAVYWTYYYSVHGKHADLEGYVAL